MSNNGRDGRDGRDGRRRRSDVDNADTERGKPPYGNSRLSPTPTAQHVPLLMTQRSQEEQQDWEGGYGTVSATAPLPNYMTAPFVQNPQNYYSSAPAPGVISAPYGQPSYQHHQWQSNGMPPPPPPPSHPFSTSQQGLHQQQQQYQYRSSSMPPKPSPTDSSMYYSDEDDVSPLPSPRFDAAATGSGSRSDGSRTGSGKQTSRKSILKKVSSFSELQDAARNADTAINATIRTGQGQHRRNNSDSMYKNKQEKYGRTNSADLSKRESNGVEFLMSTRSPLPLHPDHRKSAPMASPRKRSSSVGAGGSGSNAHKPRHQRGDSMGSMASLISVMSERSVVSDISRSAFYKEKTSSGKVRFHAPTDKIRLVTDDDLQPGHLYRVRGDDEEEGYIQYTLQSEGANDFALFDDGCACECNACIRCQHKMEQMLLSVNYELRVPDNLYQKVLGEISDSKKPCGVFFCGHHEDVDRPSILIAVVIVGVVLGALLFGTYLIHGS